MITVLNWSEQQILYSYLIGALSYKCNYFFADACAVHSNLWGITLGFTQKENFQNTGNQQY